MDREGQGEDEEKKKKKKEEADQEEEEEEEEEEEPAATIYFLPGFVLFLTAHLSTRGML